MSASGGSEFENQSPKGPADLSHLVGEANKCNAFVDGHRCTALLDTGSQVTSISESFFTKNLSDRSIQPVDQLLTVVGAGGQNVPFLGYIEVELRFSKEESGVENGYKTFALVVPDTGYNRRVPLVVGTNVTQHFQEKCRQERGGLFTQRVSLSPQWKRVYKAAQSFEWFTDQCERGKVTVKSTSRRPITIEAHATDGIPVGDGTKCSPCPY